MKMQALSQSGQDMCSKSYQTWNLDQLLLVPPVMRNALDEGHIVLSIINCPLTQETQSLDARSASF